MRAWNSTFKVPAKPMVRSAWKQQSSPRAIKSRGMKGVATNTAQKSFHSTLAGLGCIACRMDGNYQPLVSIHHVDGRTKPTAHWLVLPLCAGHHQDGTGVPGLIAVHPWKTRFEEKYGTQLSLLLACHDLLREQGYQIPEAAITALMKTEGGRP